MYLCHYIEPTMSASHGGMANSTALGALLGKDAERHLLGVFCPPKVSQNGERQKNNKEGRTKHSKRHPVTAKDGAERC